MRFLAKRQNGKLVDVDVYDEKEAKELLEAERQCVEGGEYHILSRHETFVKFDRQFYNDLVKQLSS